LNATINNTNYNATAYENPHLRYCQGTKAVVKFKLPINGDYSIKLLDMNNNASVLNSTDFTVSVNDQYADPNNPSVDSYSSDRIIEIRSINTGMDFKNYEMNAYHTPTVGTDNEVLYLLRDLFSNRERKVYNRLSEPRDVPENTNNI
jgi:hypothetical protein